MDDLSRIFVDTDLCGIPYFDIGELGLAIVRLHPLRLIDESNDLCSRRDQLSGTDLPFPNRAISWGIDSWYSQGLPGLRQDWPPWRGDRHRVVLPETLIPSYYAVRLKLTSCCAALSSAGRGQHRDWPTGQQDVLHQRRLLQPSAASLSESGTGLPDAFVRRARAPGQRLQLLCRLGPLLSVPWPGRFLPTPCLCGRPGAGVCQGCAKRYGLKFLTGAFANNLQRRINVTDSRFGRLSQ